VRRHVSRSRRSANSSLRPVRAPHSSETPQHVTRTGPKRLSRTPREQRRGSTTLDHKAGSRGLSSIPARTVKHSCPCTRGRQRAASVRTAPVVALVELGCTIAAEIRDIGHFASPGQAGRLHRSLPRRLPVGLFRPRRRAGQTGTEYLCWAVVDAPATSAPTLSMGSRLRLVHSQAPYSAGVLDDRSIASFSPTNHW
jgi:hypothetical protein